MLTVGVILLLVGVLLATRPNLRDVGLIAAIGGVVLIVIAVVPQL